MGYGGSSMKGLFNPGCVSTQDGRGTGDGGDSLATVESGLVEEKGVALMPKTVSVCRPTVDKGVFSRPNAG
jgi:hypothetical protein